MREEMVIDTATGQIGLFDGAEEHQQFVDKFKVKKTTDDCYTPENVHKAVTEWVAKEYGLQPDTFLRPFWPGADYQSAEYPDGHTVVDNPPFSIRAEIVDYYLQNGIHFFLYSPALTLLTRREICHIATGVSVTYANGAEVPTSFVTDLESCALRTAPDLYQAIKAANEINVKAGKKELPKYTYPDYVVTAAMAQRWCHYGVDYRLSHSDCVSIGALDAQRAVKKSIFGYGFLLSERAAAERAAAERAAATKWELSAREQAIVDMLSGKSGGVEITSDLLPHEPTGDNEDQVSLF